MNVVYIVYNQQPHQLSLISGYTVRHPLVYALVDLSANNGIGEHLYREKKHTISHDSTQKADSNYANYILPSETLAIVPLQCIQ